MDDIFPVMQPLEVVISVVKASVEPVVNECPVEWETLVAAVIAAAAAMITIVFNISLHNKSRKQEKDLKHLEFIQPKLEQLFELRIVFLTWCYNFLEFKIKKGTNLNYPKTIGYPEIKLEHYVIFKNISKIYIGNDLSDALDDFYKNFYQKVIKEYGNCLYYFKIEPEFGQNYIIDKTAEDLLTTYRNISINKEKCKANTPEPDEVEFWKFKEDLLECLNKIEKLLDKEAHQLLSLKNKTP